jgi:hypothetical protein
MHSKIMDHCDAEDLRAPIQLHYLLRITVPEHQPNSKLGLGLLKADQAYYLAGVQEQ